MRLLSQVRDQLAQARVPLSKPIWNTEINYGLRTGSRVGSAASPIGRSKQVANVLRTYLLNAAAGVRRVFWYRYDNALGPTGGSLTNTSLSAPLDSTRLTAAGRAYVRVQAWMHGTLLGMRHHRPCSSDRHGTYTCVVREASGIRRIYWNPYHRARVRLSADAHHATSGMGSSTRVQPRARLRVGQLPVMVTH